jgi:deoxycytidylate deaminase
MSIVQRGIKKVKGIWECKMREKTRKSKKMKETHGVNEKSLKKSKKGIDTGGRKCYNHAC